MLVGTIAVMVAAATGVSFAVANAQESAVSTQVSLERLDPSRLRIGRDSLVMKFGGLPEGSHVLELTRNEAGYRYTETVFLTSEFRRTTTVLLDSAFRITRVHQEGREFGNDTGADVQYDSTRVKGTASVVRNGRLERLTIDAPLPANAFDGSLLLAVLPILDWKIGQVHRLLMFDADEGSTSEQTLTITTEETVEVPAGTYRAFRASLTTTQLPVEIWVAQAAPHRILRMASANGETVLVR